MREPVAQSGVGAGERIAAAPAEIASAGEAESNLAAVLARALAGLADAAGASRLAAWGRAADGTLAVLAARVDGAKLCPPSEASWAALAGLSGPSELAESADPALRALVEESGFVAAAPLRVSDGEPLAMLLVGAGAGALRPRLLAALGAAAARCLRPAAAAVAAQRLARLDREVQRLDRLAAVGGLLAEIVHEIRNPLVSIKTFLHLLGEEGAARGSGRGEASVLDPRSEPQASEGAWRGEFREVAIEELRRIERLLEVVSQHARPPSAPSAEAIAEVEPAIRSVAQLVTLRAVDRRIRVEVELAELLAPVRIAGDALRQVLLNLALNAIEATPEGGAIRLTACERGGGIEIACEDEGPGVPEALHVRLFEPFFSTKSQPGGLGLAITRRLVEDAGGRVEVERREPLGSRFRVTLPLA